MAKGSTNSSTLTHLYKKPVGTASTLPENQKTLGPLKLSLAIELRFCDKAILP